MSVVETPRISVVVPVYNQKRYIAQCLDTTLAQTMGDFEAICIDDGSTDGSGAVLDAYARKDPRVKVVHRENRGVSRTRNEALRMAKGEFVAFMDPDDYYPDDRVFERLYSAAKSSGALVCGGSLAVYDEENARLVEKRLFPDRFEEEGFLDYRDFQFDYGYQRYIFSRAMLERAGVDFPPYKRFQDPPFFVNAMIAAGRFYRIRPATYVYRWSRRFSNWDDERVLHLVSAMRDDLAVAAANGLRDLFARTLARVKSDFRNEIAGHPTEEVRRVMDEIMALSLKVSKEAIPALPDGRPPKVSVVVPVYNAEKYLRQCLDSLRAQTLGDLEFICVNDGSTDKSLAIIREYQKADPRFIAIDKPNSGYGHTMNCGLAVARGEYVGIVEPDDFVKPQMYERLVAAADGNGVDFVKSGIVYHWSNRPDREWKIVSDASLVRRVLHPADDPGIFNAVMNNVTGVYRRDFLERNHIRFTETPGAAYQDNSFYLQAHFLAKSAYLLDESFYCYRQDNEASSINTKGRAFAIFEEYRRNESLFDGRPEMRAAFYGQYLYKKYKSYKYHFGRLDETAQIPFLEKMSAEFRAHHERGEVDFGIMAVGQADALRAIIDDWPRYYVTQWRLRVDAERKKADALRARAAEEQKKSKALAEEVARLRRALAAKQRELDGWRRSLGALARSEAYRTGMFVTWPARKVWGGVKCLRENGLPYTAKHFAGKVARRLGFRKVKW